MITKTKIIIAVIFILILLAIGISFIKPRSNEFNNPVILWVWERPENLYFLKDKNVTFAYLSGTVTKTNDGLVYYPRRQPLRIPDNNKTISVVRIEDKSDKYGFNDEDQKEMSDFIVESCQEKKSNISCQIDFDATKSQIDFYKKLVVEVREKLSKDINLSLTSLVSWCTISSPWFEELPIDEIVPMFFRLGKDDNLYWRKIKNGDLKLHPICQKAVGVATDEFLPNKIYLENKPIYIFNNKYWIQSDWDIIKANILKIINE